MLPYTIFVICIFCSYYDRFLSYTYSTRDARWQIYVTFRFQIPRETIYIYESILNFRERRNDIHSLLLENGFQTRRVAVEKTDMMRKSREETNLGGNSDNDRVYIQRKYS